MNHHPEEHFYKIHVPLLTLYNWMLLNILFLTLIRQGRDPRTKTGWSHTERFGPGPKISKPDGHWIPEPS